MFQLVEDDYFRPSTGLYTGIYSMDSTAASPKLLGLSNVIFSWDTLLLNALPSNLERVDCVLISSTTTVTMSVDHGKVTIVGRGDLHDPDMTSYGHTVALNIASASDTTLNVNEFTIVIYPSSAFYSDYITRISLQLSIAVGVCVFVIMAMLYCVVSLQQQMQQEKEEALHALLDAKKSYVRYISHGTCTRVVYKLKQASYEHHTNIILTQP